jgi:excisionase family DNA binding protein
MSTFIIANARSRVHISGESTLLKGPPMLECKTMTVPEAGSSYFGLSRGASYEAAKRGEIPTIRIGKLLRVPVRALEEMLSEVKR